MTAANSQTVRQIESTLTQHAQDVIDELITASREFAFDTVVDHAQMSMNSNDAMRVLGRSSGTVDRLVADVARAAYQVFLEGVRSLTLTMDDDSRLLDDESRAKLDHHCRMRVASI